MSDSTWMRLKPPPSAALVAGAEVLVRIRGGARWFARVEAVSANAIVLRPWGARACLTVAPSDVIGASVLVTGIAWSKAREIAASQKRALEEASDA